MKMIYYSEYRKKGNRFVGVGTRIVNDRKDFFKNDERFIRLMTELELGTLFEFDSEGFYDFLRKFYTLGDETVKTLKEQKKNILSPFSDLTEWSNNPFAELNEYIEKHQEEGKSLEQLVKDFDAQKQKEVIDAVPIDYSDEDRLVERMVDAFGPLGKDDFKREGGHYHCSSFVFDKHWFYEEMKKVSKLVMLFNKINEKSQRTETDKRIILEHISDCMSNVRYVHEWNTRSGEINVTPQPMNTFGEVTLMILDTFKKDMAFITCEKCGDIKRMKRESSHICRRCQVSYNKRRFNVKQDMLQGLSFEEIVKKHPRMKKDEIIEHYNNIMAKDEK